VVSRWRPLTGVSSNAPGPRSDRKFSADVLPSDSQRAIISAREAIGCDN
jgi:hypothetical protein